MIRTTRVGYAYDNHITGTHHFCAAEDVAATWPEVVFPPEFLRKNRQKFWTGVKYQTRHGLDCTHTMHTPKDNFRNARSEVIEMPDGFGGLKLIPQRCNDSQRCRVNIGGGITKRTYNFL